MSKYTDLITNYHATKPKFLDHVDLSTRPMIDITGATRGLVSAFDIDTAVGVQLDTLGLWIGRSRIVSQPISGVYFSWDTDGLGYDQGVWQGPYDPDSGYTTLNAAAANGDGNIPQRRVVSHLHCGKKAVHINMDYFAHSKPSLITG